MRTSGDAERLDLSIVLPCLDEATSVSLCVRDAWTGLRGLDVRGEVIVADNGSTDGSRSVAAEAGARVELTLRRGYGATLRHGIQSARGEYVIIADCDGSYDLTNLAGIWARLRAGDDLVIGNRFRGHIASGAMPKLNRYLGNPILSALGRTLTHTNLGDFHSGMRGFRAAAIATLDLRTDGMEYASEMISRAAAHDLRISEVPINLANDTRDGSRSHLRPFRDGTRHVVTLFMHRSRERSRK